MSLSVLANLSLANYSSSNSRSGRSSRASIFVGLLKKFIVVSGVISTDGWWDDIIYFDDSYDEKARFIKSF